MPPSVLVIGQGHGADIAFWALPKKLAAVYGINVGGMLLQNLTSAAALQPFNAVVVCDLSRKNSDPAVNAQNEYTIGAANLQAVVQLLLAYVNQGGGLYVYGHSYSGAGGLAYADTLNELLSQLGAQIPFETLAEQPSLQHQQPDGQQLSYAKAHTIAAHPATQNVASFLYPVGWRTSGYGPWTRPLSLDANWTPLLETSAAAVCTPVDAAGNPTGNPSQVPLPASIYAARTLGNGRVVLNGSESIISFFNYDYSPYANAQWGTIGMENGLPAQGVGSDGLELLVSSLQWLVAPSVAHPAYGLGGFVPPPPPPPEQAAPVPPWSAPDEALAPVPYLKGLIAAVPALGGGAGTIADFVQAAQQQKLSFLVVAGHAAQMTEAQWIQLQSECAAHTDTTPAPPDFPAGFRAIPALLTVDAQGNRFITAGPPPWPWPGPNPAVPPVVTDHLAFWFAAHAAFRAPYDISSGHYPAWLFGAYTAFPLRTYHDNVLQEDQSFAWRQNLSQGDMCMPFVMTLITDPSHVAAVPEHTYVRQADMACFSDHVPATSFVAAAADGARIDCFYSSPGAFRYTAGKLYHAGSERWRLYLRASSTSAAAGLSQVTLFDHGEVIRRYAVSGLEVDLNIDLLHDRRHVLTCEVEDVAGGRAIGGGVESQQDLMRQYFLSDRCNMGTGLMATYQAGGGPLVRLPATSLLFRGGRLHFNAPVSSDEFLPGVDGSGVNPAFLHSIRFNADVAGPHPPGGGYPVHQVFRPHESADGIVFDTPIVKRTATPDPIAHNPAVPLLDPPFHAALRQYYFYRRPATPSTVLADLLMWFPGRTPPVPQPGWRGFRQIYTDFFSTGRFSDYLVVRAVGNAVEQGVPDGNALAWEGLLSPGDFVLFPEVREGFFVLEGNLDARIEGETGPPKKMRLWTGKKATDTQRIRLLAAHTTQGVTAVEVQDDWIALRDAYGLAGQPPTGYQLQVLQGSVLSTRYLLSVQMDQWGFQASLTGANLPLRLPIETAGVHPLWTSGRVDLNNDEWFPLDVNGGTGYTTIDPNGVSSFYLGNLVTANDPRVFLTLLPHNDGGTEVEIHNPKTTAASVQVTVPITTFLAAQQTTPMVVVPARSSVRIPLA